MTVHHFGTYVAITHEAFENTTLPNTVRDLSMELAVWLHARQTEQQFAPSVEGGNSATTTTGFLNQPRMRMLRERAIVAGYRGYRPQLCNIAGILTPVGSAYSNTIMPYIRVLTDDLDNTNKYNPWEPDKWLKPDEMFISAAIPTNLVRLLNLFFVAVTRTERNFMERRKANGSFDDFNIPGVNLFMSNSATPGNFIKMQAQGAPAPQAPTPKSIPQYVSVPYTQLATLTTDNTQHFDENSTYMMQTALSEGSMWQAWVPVSTFTPATRNAMKLLYRLGLVDLRAFQTQGRGRPRLIIRVSSTGEKLLRYLAAENMLQ